MYINNEPPTPTPIPLWLMKIITGIKVNMKHLSHTHTLYRELVNLTRTRARSIV